MRKNISDLDQRLLAIENANISMPVTTNAYGELLNCQEYLERMTEVRSQLIGEVVRKYNEIGTILLTVEGIIFLTNTGESTFMSHYFRHWEWRIYLALINMIVVNLKAFNETASSGLSPMFQVDVLLASQDIILNPNLSEVCVDGLFSNRQMALDYSSVLL